METTKEQTVSETQAKRVIKRYSNRKLYDTRDSRYVTLQQIGEMVRAGEEVQIIDNKTKEDKTEVTLALILSEDLKSQPRSVPLAALRDLIQERGGRLLNQLREGTLGRFIPSTEAEQAATTEVAEEPVAAAPAPEPVKPVEPEEPAATSTKSSPPDSKAGRAEEKKGRFTELMESSISSLDERIRHIVPSAKSFSELRDEVARLSQRVEALEAELARRSNDSTSN
ncbi:MAG: polyhydroxyalkanoate synthesis regulator DNA-binding domain-containing protein [Polyangiaceae bacterium]